MPLSISSSKHRIPDLRYKSLWVMVAFVTLLLLAGGEIFWRSKKLIPSIVDSKDLWSLQRHDIYTRDGKKRLVIVGSSRSLLGIVPEVLQEQFPQYKILHLAIGGAQGYSVLKDLADDEAFDGVVIADVISGAFFGESYEDQQPWVDYYDTNWRNLGRLEKTASLFVKSWLQERMVVFGDANIKKQMDWLIRGDIPIGYLRLQFNRYRAAHYRELMTDEQLKNHRKERLASIQPISKGIMTYSHKDRLALIEKRLKPLTNTFRERGVPVIFVRMPSTEEHWAHDNAGTPKEEYWDKLNHITGMPTIHFQDDPRLNQFDCPDTSHLDAQDAPVFTLYLAELLQKYLSENKKGLPNREYLSK